MRNFKQFTRFGRLRNRGWYSDDEKTLLKKEDELVKHFRSLEALIRKGAL